MSTPDSKDFEPKTRMSRFQDFVYSFMSFTSQENAVHIFAALFSLLDISFVFLFYWSNTKKQGRKLITQYIGIADVIISIIMIVVSIVLYAIDELHNEMYLAMMNIIMLISMIRTNLIILVMTAEDLSRVIRTRGTYRADLCVKFYKILFIVIILILSTVFTVTLSRQLLGLLWSKDSANYKVLKIDLLCLVSMCLFTVIVQAKYRCAIGGRLVKGGYYRSTDEYNVDREAANFLSRSFILFIIGWAPYCILVYLFPEADKNKVSISFLFAMSRAFATAYLYQLRNEKFRIMVTNFFRRNFTNKPALQAERQRRVLQRSEAAVTHDAFNVELKPLRPQQTIITLETENVKMRWV